MHGQHNGSFSTVSEIWYSVLLAMSKRISSLLAVASTSAAQKSRVACSLDSVQEEDTPRGQVA